MRFRPSKQGHGRNEMNVVQLTIETAHRFSHFHNGLSWKRNWLGSHRMNIGDVFNCVTFFLHLFSTLFGWDFISSDNRYNYLWQRKKRNITRIPELWSTALDSQRHPHSQSRRRRRREWTQERNWSIWFILRRKSNEKWPMHWRHWHLFSVSPWEGMRNGNEKSLIVAVGTVCRSKLLLMSGEKNTRIDGREKRENGHVADETIWQFLCAFSIPYLVCVFALFCSWYCY